MNGFFDDSPDRQEGMYNQPMQWQQPVGQQFPIMQQPPAGQHFPYVQMMPAQPGFQAQPAYIVPGYAQMGVPSEAPTGAPMGPAFTQPPTTFPGTTADDETTPETLQNVAFTAGFLRTQIGRRVRVEFLIGTSNLTDRTGILIGVGASYILLREPQEDNIIMCDLFSIKFVTVYY